MNLSVCLCTHPWWCADWRVWNLQFNADYERQKDIYSQEILLVGLPALFEASQKTWSGNTGVHKIYAVSFVSSVKRQVYHSVLLLVVLF